MVFVPLGVDNDLNILPDSRSGGLWIAGHRHPGLLLRAHAAGGAGH